MCEASISGAVHEIVNAINAIMPQWIKFPVRANEIEAIQQQLVCNLFKLLNYIILYKLHIILSIF